MSDKDLDNLYGIQDGLTDVSRRRLAFAARFAFLDLKALWPGEWDDLRIEVAGFLFHRGHSDAFTRTGTWVREVDPPEPHDLSPEDLRSLQRETRETLVHFVDHTEGDLDLRVRARAVPFSTAFNLWAISGSVRDAFLVTLQLELVHSPRAFAISRCADPSCRKIFLRNRKQRYCSPQCHRRTYMRRYRKKPAVQERESERAHRRYAKRLQEKGIPAKPKRRPRTTGPSNT